MEIGRVEALFRYPVKSMAREGLDAAALGWHGIAGDRRLALRRTNDSSGFPWLTASRLPDLLLFTPHCPDDQPDEALPTYIRAPDGEQLSVFHTVASDYFPRSTLLRSTPIPSISTSTMSPGFIARVLPGVPV